MPSIAFHSFERLLIQRLFVIQHFFPKAVETFVFFTSISAPSSVISLWVTTSLKSRFLLEVLRISSELFLVRPSKYKRYSDSARLALQISGSKRVRQREAQQKSLNIMGQLNNMIIKSGARCSTHFIFNAQLRKKNKLRLN